MGIIREGEQVVRYTRPDELAGPTSTGEDGSLGVETTAVAIDENACGLEDSSTPLLANTTERIVWDTTATFS